ncbi:MAG TPA: ribonuclease P protein component [Candidatus Paceibacterota bacterium]
MLPKNRRIKRSDFDLLSRGKTFSGNFLSLKVSRASGNSKVTFIVSKKVAKNAADRNRLRRRGYGQIKSFLKKITDGFLLAFYFKSRLGNISKEDLYDDIESLLSKSGLI